jgi:hypothetical protein
MLSVKAEYERKFKQRSFDEIESYQQLAERFNFHVLWQSFKVAQAVIFMQTNLTNTQKTHAFFTRNYPELDSICDKAEAGQDFRFSEN